MRFPLRLRVTLAFGVGMAVVLSALGLFLYVRVGHDLMNGIDMELRSRGQVGGDGIAHRITRLVRAPGHLIDPDVAFAQFLGPGGAILDSSSAVSGAPMLSRRDLGTAGDPAFFTTHVHGVDDPARVLAVPRGGGPSRVYVVVGATLGDRNEALARLALALAVGGPIALGLVSWGGWVMAGSALRPVERMRREAAAISLAEPAPRLSVPETGDELARLGSTLNSMLGRLQEAVQKEQRFLDWASHELRTPLGVLKMELELALARSRTPEELKGALEDALAETDRVVRLAEHLLVLSRTRGGAMPLHREDTSVAWVLERAAASHQARGEAAGMAFSVECADAIHARLDRERLRQALDDLIDNSLRHARPGTAVVLSAQRSDGRVSVTVRDDGPGFSAELLDGHGTGDGPE